MESLRKMDIHIILILFIAVVRARLIILIRVWSRLRRDKMVNISRRRIIFDTRLITRKPS